MSTFDKIQERLASVPVVDGYKRPCKALHCADGFSVSVQGNDGAYCSPRNNLGPYAQVELGFPSDVPNEETMQYVEDAERPTDTVYGYVPIDIVVRLLDEHGGVVDSPE